jgi:hypothetical protein
MIMVIWLDKLTLGQDDLPSMLTQVRPQYPRTCKNESIRLSSLCFVRVFLWPQVLRDGSPVSISST